MNWEEKSNKPKSYWEGYADAQAELACDCSQYDFETERLVEALKHYALLSVGEIEVYECNKRVL